MMGCLLSLVLLGVLILITFRVGPPYFAWKSFESDLRKETSRAGANLYDEETVIKSVLDLAKRNELPLKRENITVERAAGTISITVRVTLPMDLIVYQRDVNYEIKTTSLVGRL